MDALLAPIGSDSNVTGYVGFDDFTGDDLLADAPGAIGTIMRKHE